MAFNFPVQRRPSCNSHLLWIVQLVLSLTIEGRVETIGGSEVGYGRRRVRSAPSPKYPDRRQGRTYATRD